MSTIPYSTLATFLSTDPTRPNITHPFWEGSHLTFTDGRHILSIQGKEITDIPTIDRNHLAPPPNTDNIWNRHHPDTSHYQPLTAIEHEIQSGTCPHCDRGTWQCQCPDCDKEHPCEDCDGKGNIEIIIPRATNFGHHTYPTRQLLQLLPLPDLRICPCPAQKDHGMLSLRFGKTGKGLIMPLRATTQS